MFGQKKCSNKPQQGTILANSNQVNMDTSTVLEKYTQDLSNLPLEVRHLLEEIKAKMYKSQKQGNDTKLVTINFINLYEQMGH